MVPILRISYERRRRGWSQADVARHFAALAGPSRLAHQSGVSQLELGQLVPTDRELDVLGIVFGVTPAFLLLKPLNVVDADEQVQR